MTLLHEGVTLAVGTVRKHPGQNPGSGVGSWPCSRVRRGLTRGDFRCAGNGVAFADDQEVTETGWPALPPRPKPPVPNVVYENGFEVSPQPPPPAMPHSVAGYRARGRPDDGYLDPANRPKNLPELPTADAAAPTKKEAPPPPESHMFSDVAHLFLKLAQNATPFKDVYTLVDGLCGAAAQLGSDADDMLEVNAAREALQAAMNARAAASTSGDFASSDDVLIPPLMPLLEAADAAMKAALKTTPARVIRHAEARGEWTDQHGDMVSVTWSVYLAGLVAHVGAGDDSTATQFLLERMTAPTGGARLQFHIDRGNSGNISVCDVDVAFPPGPYRMRDRLRMLLDAAPDLPVAVGRVRSNVPDGTNLLCPAPVLAYSRDSDDDASPEKIMDLLVKPVRVKSSVGLMVDTWPRRQVVLYGTSGLGKTALARVLASRALAVNGQGAFPGGVYFVDMSHRGSRSAWGAALGCALGCPVVGGPDPETAAMMALRGGGARQRTLLVLDSCDTALDRKDATTRAAFLAMLRRIQQLGDHMCMVITTVSVLDAQDVAAAKLDSMTSLRVGPLPLKTCTEALVAAFPAAAELTVDPNLSRRHAKEAAQLAGRSPLAISVLVPALRAVTPVQKAKALETLLHTLRLARGAIIQGNEFNAAGECCEATCINPWSNLAELLAPSLYFNTAADNQEAKNEAKAEIQAAQARLAGHYNAEHGAAQATVTGLQPQTYADVQKACAAFALAALPTVTAQELEQLACGPLAVAVPPPNPDEAPPAPVGDAALVAACALSVITGSFDAKTARQVVGGLPGGWAIKRPTDVDASLALLRSRSLLNFDQMTQRYSMPQAVRAAARELPAGQDITTGATPAWLRCLETLVTQAVRDHRAGAPAPGNWSVDWEAHAIAEASSSWAEAGAPDNVTRDLVLRLRAFMKELQALRTPEGTSDAPIITAHDVSADVGAAIEVLRTHAEECVTTGRPEDAAGAYERLIELQRTAVGGYDPALAGTHAAYATCLLDQNRAEEAAEALEKALTIQTLSLGADDPEVGHTLLSLVAARRQLGDIEAAQSAARRGLLNLSTAHGLDHPEVGAAQVALADVAKDAGHLNDALDSYRLGMRNLQVALGADAVEVGYVSFNIAQVYASQGDALAAESEAKIALAILTKQLGADDPKTKAAARLAAHSAEDTRLNEGGDAPWKPSHQGHPWSRWQGSL